MSRLVRSMRLPIALVLAGSWLVATPDAVVTADAASVFTEFVLPSANSWPVDVAAGPGGTIWVTEMNANKVAKVVPTATAVSITEFPVPTAASKPARIAAGPDGNMWFTENDGVKVARVTASGAINEYGFPLFNFPVDVVAGPDGNLWVTGGTGDKVSKVTPTGTVTPFDFPDGSLPVEITDGPDGNLWVTQVGANAVAKLTTAGTIAAAYPMPTPGSGPRGITTGPDGNLWVLESAANKVAKVTTSGTITEYPLPTADSHPYGITAGLDGNLWVTETDANQLARVTPSGAITEYSFPDAAGPQGIATGADGQLWIAETDTNRLARYDPMATVAFAVPSASVRENVGTATLRVTRGGNTSAASSIHYARTAGTASGADFSLPAGTLYFAPGQVARTISVPIVNDTAREDAESIVVTLTAPDANTRLGSPAAMTLTITASDQRPDGMISTASGSGYVGNNIYNSTAAGQTKTQAATRGATRTFYARICNDGSVRNTFTAKASAAPAAVRVHYFRGGTDITARLRSQAGWPVTLATGAYAQLKVTIHVTATAAIGVTYAVRVSASWSGDVTTLDRIQAAVRVVR